MPIHFGYQMSVNRVEGGLSALQAPSWFLIYQLPHDQPQVGRATFGNPFIFKEIKQELGLDIYHLPDGTSENLKLRLNTYLKQAKLAFEEGGERALIESRKHISGYVRSFDNASSLRQRLIFAKSVEEIEGIISEIK